MNFALLSNFFCFLPISGLNAVENILNNSLNLATWTGFIW